MKKLLFLTLAAFVTASFLSYRHKAAEPVMLSPDCYISCYNADIREQFREEANTQDFALMHPKPIPFQLQDGTGKTIQFQAGDGTQAQGYEILSKKKTDKWVFVIQEWWGLNDYIKKESETLSKELEGVNVLAIDLYDGKVAATADSAMKLVQGAKTDRLETIVKAALTHAGSKAKIYTIGWCFGGMWSLQTSLLAGKQAAGCVMYYGRPENNLEKLKGLNCDVIGFFGNKDRSPSPEVVNKFEQDMASINKKLTTHKYEAGHGFANPSNPSFNKEASEDAHAKAIAFIKSH